jgi:hypothetical protein
MIPDAEDRFMTAAKAFQALEKRFYGGERPDDREWLEVELDLEAATPGLSDLNRGRAMVLKASGVYFRTFPKGLLFAVREAPNPERAAALTLAREGREYLRREQSTADLAWADSVVHLLEEVTAIEQQ